MSRQINPNSDKEYINGLDINLERTFPKFIKSIELRPFRHINDLKVDFIHPISVISGTNRSGKSTLLMAIACSHFNFQKRNSRNGNLERQTWSSLMKFTNHDIQEEDWTYFITYKTGLRVEPKRGQRKKETKKWNGIGKKESQIRNRQVIFIDLDRIVPARNFTDKIYSLAKVATLSNISDSKANEIESYISYVLEETFRLNKLAAHLDKDIFKYKSRGEYSSYNAATGEEVLAKIIIDIVEAEKKSLILLDEVELGLHPRVQRRLIDVLFNIARNDEKQFILTTHSSTILSALPKESRIFIERNYEGVYKSIPKISVNAALSKMDSVSYPIIDLFCEDKESELIINKAITDIQKEKKLINFQSHINIIVSGSADITYDNFKAHQRTYENKKIKTGFACILDGDRRELQDKGGNLTYPPEDCLHFLYSNECPERFLIRTYLMSHPNTTLEFHLENSNPHILFEKFVEHSIASNKAEAFDLCWNEFVKTSDGELYFNTLKEFILQMVRKYSPDL